MKNFDKSSPNSSSTRPSRFDNNYSSNKFQNNRYNPYSRPGSGGNNYPPQDLQYEHTLSKFSHDSPYCDLNLFLKPDHNVERDMFKKVSEVINFDQNMSVDIKATGSNIQKPMNSFEDCNFHEIIQNSIKLSGYSRPTPVQKNAIPIIQSGRDLMACAQTGSGKTATFLIPIMNSIYERKEQIESYKMVRGRRQWMPVGLILAPTRELALQIYNESKKFAYRSNLRSFVVYGGADIRTQMRNLDSNGCHLLVATPGRLNDLYNREILSFENIKYLVLDEADRMLDMGFEPQIREIVQQKNMPQNRQTLLFSATFPKQIQMMAKDFLHDYIFLAVGRVGSTNINITQKIVWAGENEKINCLLDTLNANPDALTLIFVETRYSCDELDKYLRSNKYPAVSIHGKKSQGERERSLQMFRNGKKQILVATAVAARGLDVSNVKVVINFDIPNDIDDYVHRIGRTGRSGASGQAISFFNEKNRPVANQLLNLLKETEQEIPEFLTRMAARGGGGGGGGYKRSNYGNFRQAANSERQSNHHYFDYRVNDS